MDEKVKEEEGGVYKFKKDLGGVMYAAPIINLTYMSSEIYLFHWQLFCPFSYRSFSPRNSKSI